MCMTTIHSLSLPSFLYVSNEEVLKEHVGDKEEGDDKESKALFSLAILEINHYL